MEQEMAEPVNGEVVPYEAPPPPSSLFGTTEPTEVIQKATAAADALKDVLEKKQLLSNIKGKKHVRVEGWQLLGSMLGVTAVCVATEPVEGGWKATVEARTLGGAVVGRADALCTKHEKSGPWKGSDDYARLSMAQTRATSKALKGPLGFVVSLAGYETTPAEEMDEHETVTKVESSGKPVTEIEWGEDLDLAEQLKKAFKALHYTKGKVKLTMAGCTSQEDRENLLQKLQEDVDKAITEDVVDAEVVG